VGISPHLVTGAPELFLSMTRDCDGVAQCTPRPPSELRHGQLWIIVAGCSGCGNPSGSWARVEDARR
jgi:hypothetical protein